METTVWIGRGFNPDEGTLRLDQGALTLTIDGNVTFEGPVPQLDVRWPWYSFGAQFWATGNGRRYFVSFLHTGNSTSSWWRGMKTGWSWHRAIKSASAHGMLR
jgi:hypothetical protein